MSHSASRASTAPSILGRKCRAGGQAGSQDQNGSALVAEVAAEAAVEIEAAIWDLSALQIIVEEAGGRFTDLTAARTVTGGTGVSTNGLVHHAVLQLLS